MQQFCTVKNTANRFGITPRRVQTLCETGRIAGAVQRDGIWYIPSNSEKPADARKRPISTDTDRVAWDEDSFMTLKEICSVLSISEATGRNWIRLGKLRFQKKVGKVMIFEHEYVNQILTELQKNNGGALKSRRNKSKVSGSAIYENYIDSNSPNQKNVKDILLWAESFANLEKCTNLILAEMALQLLRQTGKIQCTEPTGLLDLYWKKELSIGSYEPLIIQFLDDVSSVDISNVKDLRGFHIDYCQFEDTLGFIYISLRCLSKRKENGAYYTPKLIANQMVSQLHYTSNCKILDPCCGSGNFLLALLENGASLENLYGFDIDSISVALTRINVAVTEDISDMDFCFQHFVVTDTLLKDENEKYDIVVGNPPWGYSFTDEMLYVWSKKFACASLKTAESYDLFIEKSIRLLRDDGRIVFVLPEAVLNVKAHQIVREQILQNTQISTVEYLGNAFSGVQCPSIILSLSKTARPFSTQGIHVITENETFKIDTERQIDSECFSFGISNAEYEIIRTLEQRNNYTYLEGNADFALGIVTGDNKTYLRSELQEGYEPVLKGADIEKFHINPARAFLKFEPENFQQVAPEKRYRAPEKLLYRFISNKLTFAYDNKQTLSLNSCNLLIPHINGLSIRYIMAILNSSVAQFYFEKKFQSVKVLRSHIEKIPIPIVDAKIQALVEKKVDRLAHKNGQADLLEELNREVAMLFGLSEDEYTIILKCLRKSS